MDGSSGLPPPRVAYDRTPIHRGSVFAVERVTFRDDAGRVIIRDIVRHPGAVTVIPVRDDGSLVMIRNWRVAVGTWLDEFCAGKLEPGEDPALAAARELKKKQVSLPRAFARLASSSPVPALLMSACMSLRQLV